MTSTTTTREPVKLYARPRGSKRWQLVGTYATSEAAWNAAAAVPKGHAVWINDQPKTEGNRRD